MVAGVVAGAAVTGAFSSLGPLAMTLTGYAGVLLANFAAAYLEGWRRGLFLPGRAGRRHRDGRPVPGPAGRGRAAGGSCRCCCCSRPSRRRWSPSVVRDERPVALPTAVGCLAGAVLLALPDRLLGPGTAAVLLTVFYGVAMALGSGLDAPSRKATSRAAAVVRAGRGAPPRRGRAARGARRWSSSCRGCARWAGPGGPAGT